MVLLCTTRLYAQSFSKNYIDEPLPNVLRDIDAVYTDGNINFIFNELEDFTVTANVKATTVVQAIYKVVGFYPIQVSKKDNDIYLECWQKESGRIKGRLLDENMSPVEFANVHLFNPVDSSYITGGVSNANGDFVIPIDANRVLMKINCLGYMPYSKVHDTKNIGIIRMLTNAKVLSEVKVEQSQFVYDGDKMVAYPTATQLKHSYDFFSLLNMQPFAGLYVDEMNRTINVMGGQPVVLIDGVKCTSRDLLTIQPKNIKRIEYSMNVPMKYQDSGVSGIIYVYLKNPKAAGGSVYFNGLSAVNAGFVNADVVATYNQGKSQFTLDYGFEYRNYKQRVIDNKYSYIGDDFRVDLNEIGSESPFDYNDHILNAGYNYRHDNTMLFSAKLKNEFFTRHASEAGYVEDSFMGGYNRVTANRSYSYQPSLDLYLQKEWKGGHTLEAQVVGSLSDDGYERTYNDQIEETGEMMYFPSKVNTDHLSLVSEVAYKKTVSKKSILSAGLQNQLSKTENEYVVNDYTTTLQTNNNYAYVNYQQIIGKKTSLNLGTGVKYIQMQSESNNRDFVRNLSSLNFTSTPLSNLYLSLTGSYTPIIPSLSSLTDLVQVNNEYLLINGNPDLESGHRFATRFAISTDYKKKLGATLVNTLNYSINPYYTCVSYLGNGKFLGRAENYNKWLSYEARLALTLNEVFNKHFSARLEAHYHRYETSGDDWQHFINSLGVNCTLTGTFGNFMAQMQYRLPYKTLSGETVSMTEEGSQLTLGYRYKNWNFMASGFYLFSKSGTEYPKWTLSEVNPVTLNCYIKDNANMFVLSVKYNVSFGKLFGNTKKRTLNNSSVGAAVMTL